MKKAWLEHIYQQLHQDGYLWARQCCFYHDEYAKEVMQLVYLKLLEGKARYNNQSAIKTWFFAVIRYTAIDYLKKQQQFVSLVKEPDTMHIPEETKEQTLEYTRLLKQLPARQQQVLLLYFYHDQTLAEIAEVLDISLGSVRTHYDRGKKKLKSILINQQELWQRMIN